jgi:bla regulator protein blaR1
MPGGGLRVECLSLKTIITWAYEVQDYQVSDGPAWVESTRWTIIATAGAVDTGNPIDYEKMDDAQRKRSMDLVRLRLQALLAERFHLTLRHEAREQTIYALTIAKSGTKLKESADQSRSGFLRRGRGQIEARGAQLDALAQFLAVDLLRPVVDRTGLSAHYDFKLDWSPDLPGASGSGGRDAGADTSGPTLLTAIQEQLGLRLESRKGPVETLVIEHAEKPEN